MTLRLYTARLGVYRGTDLLDITRGSGLGDGLAFAPSEALLWPALRARKQGGAAWLHAWEAYVPAYQAEMLVSSGATVPLPMLAAVLVARGHGVIPNPDAWTRLLARDVATIACACWDGVRCHRHLLATILVGMGVTYEGERVIDD